ncbi:Transcriptional regulator, LacI family [Acidisarcina polymorpha]|uniref:Transcriptional regulator, LacI family n=1 Tax=Acidisarcina polymorpha TaxID=2211140 RepID=A0A2Z5FU50_9BACT|nr:LacI family DNA-binding transcriptional regulator [Acidisarcina polymorpha]AXC10363.1 Transcriptional regulator, LacI family [Acidisarcina polymorpha]
MQRNATMADVAKLAGVGTMTVSRLLSGSVTVSESTAKRIHKAIARLNYQPNEVARALRGVKTRTIGVIVPYLYDPFFATCAHAIATVAKEHGYSVLVTTSTEDPAIEEREASQMLRRLVEGMVIIPAMQKESYLHKREFQNCRIVTLDRPAPDARFDSVLVQNQMGAKLAVDHLVGHGHTRIACLGLRRDLYTMKMRYEGYRQALSGAKLKAEPYIDCSGNESIAQTLSKLLGRPNPPTAIFCSNNLTMRQALLALNEIGISIPGDVAIAGFDDFELAEILHPTLTVVRQPSYDVGRVAANALFENLLLPRPPERGKEIMLPVQLVIRRSCGCRLRTTKVLPGS